MAATRKWQLIEPEKPVPGVPQPPFPIWMQGLATLHPWMARDASTGLPNEMLAEQLLAIELGQELESQGQHKTISIVRMVEKK
jgi:hypothetical protein